MALRALTLSDTIDFTSKFDKGAVTSRFVPVDPDDPSKGEIEQKGVASDATIFKLAPLDVFLMGYIYDNASTLSGEQGTTKIGIHTRVNQTNVEAVRFGLKGLVNFLGKDGDHVRFKTTKVQVNGRDYDAVSDDILRMFGVRLMQELADKVKEISEVGEDDEKNSDGQ